MKLEFIILKGPKELWFFLYALFFLTSCGTRIDRSQVITYWSSNATPEIEFSDYFVEKWNTGHALQVVSQPLPEGQSSEEVIMAAVVGRTTPDIYANMWPGLVELYAKSGVLVPLDTIRGFLEFLSERCGEKVIGEITSADGHIYQIPWKMNPFMTIYNQRLTSGLGLEEAPRTYGEYLRTGKEFSLDIDGDGYVDQWIGDTETKNIWRQRLMNFYPLYLAASHGAPLIKDNKPVFNNKYAIGVFAFLQDLYKNGYFPNESNTVGSDKFLAGQIATKWTGAWDVTHLERFKDEDFTYDISPMPVPDDHTGDTFTYADSKSIVVFNTCTRPTQTWEFIKTLIDDEGDLKFLELSGQIPRRQKLGENSRFKEILSLNPKLVPFVDQSKYVYDTDNCEVLIEVFDIISQEYEVCVIHNKKTPEQAIQDAFDAVNVLLGNFEN